ncbi:Ig-like domain-containing protein [Algoriphagus halophilus]|uniref:Ig-like domain-containing protein n=1 Tax=Algoriphagus halophilus TaxID=226505 RepID=UPI0013564CB6|nr:Ig-like domain-containing protein [Algoriphagus halophilus]
MIFIFIVNIPSISYATDYYFSSSKGDDSRSITEAQNPETPWKTIDKLNAISSALKGGDRVLFAAGEVFYGTINVVRGGEVGNPIVYTSYGLGPAAQITSLETISEWRSLGGGLYEASLPNLQSSVIQILEIDNTPQEIGRTPNSFSESPFFEIQNVLGTNSISGEGSFGDLTGAEVVIRKNNWIIDRHPISSSSGNTINFESINTAYTVKSGYGYFVQNHVSTLDSFGEWAYNPTLKTVTVFLGAKKPSTFKIKVANKDNLVTNNRYIQNITFSNLHFKGSNKSIFSLKNSGNFKIEASIMESAGDNAVYVEEVPDLTLSKNTIKNNLNGGLFVYYGSPRVQVTNNLFENSMPYQGMGKSSDLTGIALYIASDSDNSLIEKNQIINTSYNGIHFGGDYTIVKNNFIERFCVFKQDGGGIYTNADGQTNRNNTGREIVGNIILNGLGNIDGNEEKLFLANGIYLDDMAAGLKVYKNTISNINGNGIFLHNNNNVEVSDNLFYKIPTQILASHDPIGTPIRDIIVKENQLSRIYDNELVMDFNSIDYDVAQFGQVDNNYFLDPYHTNFFFYSREPSDGQIGQTRNLKNWGDAFGYDLNSKQPRFNLDRYEILTQDPIKSSTFDANIDFVAGTYGGTGQWIPDGIEGGSLSLQPNPGGDVLSYLQIGPVEVGDQILIEFDSKSVEENKEVILFLEKTFDQDQVGSLRFFATTTESERIQIGFIAEVATPNESIVIKIPDPSEPVIFDNIEISKVTTRELNILEYVYFNYNNSDEEVTYPLSGIYRNAKNEFFFQKVTIPPYESVLLVRLELDLPDLPESSIEISITDPAPNTVFYNGDNIDIKTQITDPNGTLSKVYFYQGDSLLTRIYQPPFQYTWPDPAPGPYNLKAVAYDILGRTSESEIVPVSVLEETLQNQPPTVEIITPSNNQSIDLGQDVLISTFPQDADGTVDRVEIYEGNNLLGTINSSPYEITWTPSSINSYTLYAKAFDTEGAEGQSGNITVNITEPPSANLPPTVEITDPLEDQFKIFGQDILIQTNPFDPENKIQRVDFYSGTDLIGTSESAPFSFNWTNAEAKDHALKSIIYDEQGANSESSVVNIHVIDTSLVDFPPIVELVQPIKETILNSGALIEIAAEIQDPQNNLDRVEIYSNGNLIGTIFANPFELDWTADVQPGTYLLYAIAYDTNGGSNQSKSVIVHIIPPSEENLPPTITISQPITGDDYHYAQKILVKTNPYDPENDLKKVDIYIDGELVDVIGAEPYNYEWTKIPIGTHELYAVATDNDGQSTSSELVEITVSNYAPSISIENPLDGQTFTKGEDVLIQTNPIDPENEIEHVEFFYNEQIFGIAFEAPYELNWESPPPGTYTLKTKVFDVYGLTAESSRPVITVLDNQPPSITIEEPVDGQKFSLGEDILIKTNPIDPEGDIDHVEFFYNEQIFAIVTEAPYEYNWVSPPAGTYTLKTKVFDGEGLTAESSRPVITVQNNQPPTITIEEPVDGQIFSLGENILIRTNPIDPEGDIDHVEFFYNEQIFAIVTEAPYEYNWVSPPAGTYTLKAKVFDGGGLTAESSRPTIVVNQPPIISFISPNEGQKFFYNESILFKLAASDPENGLQKVELYSDGELIAVIVERSLEFNWTDATPGFHRIEAVVYDQEGLTSKSEINIQVLENQPPSITIEEPLDGQTFNLGEDILIRTNPIDPEGEIDHVEFFYNEQIFAIVTEAPYEFNWESPPAGTYTLKTKVFDGGGLTAESTRPVVTVLDNQPPTITIEEPVDGQTFNLGEDILIRTNPVDPEGDIDHVEFFYNEQIFAIVTEAPYEFNWESPPAGTYTLKTKVFDGGGLTAESTRPVVTVLDNQPPTITIEEPVDGQTFNLGEDILIRTNPVDPEGDIDHVEFFYNEQIFAIVTEAPYEFNWESPPAGTYTLKTKVFDGGGLTAESTRPTVTVINNLPPSISIISPTDGQVFKEGDNVLIQTNPIDPEGDIDHVEFFYNEQIFAIAFEPPYEFNWISPPPGTYTLKTKVFDGGGLTAESSRPVITVTPKNNGNNGNGGKRLGNQSTDSDSPFEINSSDIAQKTVALPNPAINEVRIRYENRFLPLNAIIRVFDMNGKEIKAKIRDQSDYQVTLDISSLAPGNYVIVLHHSNGIIESKKIIKL